MKNVFQLGFIIFVMMFTMACTNNKTNGNLQTEKASFQAKILENKGTYFVVQPDENSEESSSADQIHLSISDANLIDENKNELTVEDFVQNMTVKITYNGMIAESYPAQIHKVYEVKILQ